MIGAVRRWFRPTLPRSGVGEQAGQVAAAVASAYILRLAAWSWWPGMTRDAEKMQKWGYASVVVGYVGNPTARVCRALEELCDRTTDDVGQLRDASTLGPAGFDLALRELESIWEMVKVVRTPDGRKVVTP